MKLLKRFFNRGKCKGTMENLALMANVYHHLWMCEPTERRIKYAKIFLKLHRYCCEYMTRAIK